MHIKKRHHQLFCALPALGMMMLAAARSGLGGGDPGATSQVSAAVVDAQGRPVADASVECYHYQVPSGLAATIAEEPELCQRTVTDATGAFSFSFAPGTTLALVKKAGLAPAWKIWASTLADSSDPLVLGPPTVLAGVVVDENRKPVAGAKVWVAGAIIADVNTLLMQEDRLIGRPARECFSAVTGADGRFRIENLPTACSAGLAASKPGKALCPIPNGSTGAMEFRSGQDNIQLMLGPAGAIEGKVAIVETDQPLAGVKLWLEPASPGLYRPESREPVESDTSGTFRIPDVQPGDYRIVPTMRGQPAPDWVVAPEYAQVTVAAGETARDALIRMTKGVLVEVMVVATNTPIPVANVAVTSSQATAYAGTRTAYTGTNGIALLRVLPGTCYFSALSPGYVFPVRNAAQIEAGRTNHFEMEAVPSPRIKGLIHDPSGAAVPGALVSFHPGHYPGSHPYAEARTDESGRYELILQPSPYSAFSGGIRPTNFILARSLQRNLVDFVEFVQIPGNLDLTLQPGITLSGCVKDTAGAPISGATAEVRFLEAGSIARVEERPAPVDAQGAFAIAALPQGREYSLMISGIRSADYGISTAQMNGALTRTDHYEFPPFVLKRANLVLAGHVVGLDGKPLAGATVFYGGEGQRPFITTKSDSMGYFEFKNVVQGPVRVSTSHSDTNGGRVVTVSDRVQASGGDTNIVLLLRSLNARSRNTNIQ
ncbi:MAG: hypothetical protein ABSC18_08800 [Verrucomicrobiota bacterium]